MTEKLARPHTRADYLKLKSASRRVVTAAGGQQSAACITRVVQQNMSRYGGPNEPQFMPVDVVADLETDIGDPIITRVLADLAGYSLVKKREGNNQKPFIQHLSEVTREQSDVVSALADALKDGEVSPDEAQDILKEIEEAEQKLASLKTHLKSLIEGK